MNTLPSVPMSPDSLEPDALYVWALPHGEKKVDDEGEQWFFEVGLVGELHGPFALGAAKE